MKVLLFLISFIRTDDEEFKEYEFSIPLFCKVCGIKDNSGGNYTYLKKTIKALADKSMWIENPKNKDELVLVRLIEQPVIDKKHKTIRLKISDALKPSLLELKGKFTEYELVWQMVFSSKYSIRLYELACCIQYDNRKAYTKEYDLEELKKRMGAEKYQRYIHFKDRALEPAINEINATSDKIISYEPIKDGKQVAKIKITVQTKTAGERVLCRSEAEKKLGTTEPTLWDRMAEAGWVYLATDEE